jgi:ABC-type molybdenum transport system ATPase subunit/photorepair protein PhrA
LRKRHDARTQYNRAAGTREGQVTFNLSVSLLNGQALDFQMKAGETVFVLGANGAGKSSLMHRFYSTNRQNSRRISAHRQTWFESNAIQISARQKKDQEANALNWDADQASRWRDHYTGVRPSLAIYDLLDAENVRARKIATAVDDGLLSAV